MILTQLSLFWFEMLREIVPNHVVASNVKDYPEEVWKYRKDLKDRSMLVTRAQMYPIECVVRGYLAGSGWKDYVATGMVCGVKIEPGLREGDRLSRPIFTPATKSFRGTHDENITSTRWRLWWVARRRRNCATSAEPLQSGGGARGEPRHFAGRHEIRIWVHAMGWCWPMRC